MEYAYLPFEFPDLQILLVNTLVSHTLAASEYNLRRQQCRYPATPGRASTG